MSNWFFNYFCRLGDGKEYLFQAKDEVRHRFTLRKQYLREVTSGFVVTTNPERGNSVKLFFHSSGGNELLDSFHPGLSSIRTRRLTRRSTGAQPCHDHASHLSQLCWRWRSYHAQQRWERQGSREEVQLFWQEEIEQSTARSYVCQNFNKVKQAGRKVQPGQTNILQAPRNVSTARLWLTENIFFLSSTSFKCHLCSHSPHSYATFRGTSHCKSSSIQVTSAKQQGSSFWVAGVVSISTAPGHQTTDEGFPLWCTCIWFPFFQDASVSISVLNIDVINLINIIAVIIIAVIYLLLLPIWLKKK